MDHLNYCRRRPAGRCGEQVSPDFAINCIYYCILRDNRDDFQAKIHASAGHNGG